MTNIQFEAGGFTLSLMNMNNVMDIYADFISTLEIISDDLLDNETTVTCRAGGNQKQLVISKSGKNQVSFFVYRVRCCNILSITKSRYSSILSNGSDK